jgi:hypothetical protein
MKMKYITKYYRYQSIMRHSNTTRGLLAAGFALLVSWSCTDDPIARKSEQSDNIIRFDSWIYTGNENKSRANSDRLYEEFRAEKLENEDLYLLTMVQDGIDATKLAGNKTADSEGTTNLDGPLSRSTLTTTDMLLNTYLKGDKNNYKWLIDLYGFKYENKTSYNNVAAASATLQNVIDEVGASNVTYFIQNKKLVYDESATEVEGRVAMKLKDDEYMRWDADASNRMTFYGIFPSNTDHRNNSASWTYKKYVQTVTDGVLKIQYDVQCGDNNTGNTFDQHDIMCATFNCVGDGSTNNQTVDLQMKHLFAGVNVALGEGFENCVISGISLSGTITTSDTYNCATGAWEGNNKTANNTMSLSNIESYNLTATSSDAVVATNSFADWDYGSTILVIPQTLPDDLWLTLTYKNTATGNTATKYAKLTGTWEAGKTYTYKLSTNDKQVDYYLSTEYTTMKYGWDGNPAGNGTTLTSGGNTIIKDYGNIRVKSYKAITDNSGTTTYEAVPVTAQGLTTTDATASGISITGPNDIGSEIATDYRTYTDATDNVYKAKGYNYVLKATMGRQSEGTPIPSDEETTITGYANTTFGSNTTVERIDLSKYKQEFYQTTSGSYTPYHWYSSSGYGDTRYTSNCYMLNHPGYYTLPCVYGNSIFRNSRQENTYSLGTSTGTSTSGTDYGSAAFAMNNLQSYTGGNIINNWMNSSSQNSSSSISSQAPTSAKLLWSDVPNLITSVNLRSGNTTRGEGTGEFYIDFNVSSGTTFKPGNAVIAVFAGSNIMWSWHIWVTPHARNDTFTADCSVNSDLGSKSFLTVPLGYVESSTRVWPAREYKVRITQSDGGKYTDVALEQDEHQLPQASCCYYQWGRKDPFPGFVATETSGAMAIDGTYETTVTRRAVYNTDSSNPLNYNVTTLTDAGSGIRRPTWFAGSKTQDGETSNRFPNKNYYDLWGCTSDYNDNNKTGIGTSFPSDIGKLSRKTVYDPCPIGFKVPPIHGFPAMTYAGNNYSTTQSLWVNNATDESTMYNLYINTPYTTHVQFINNLGFSFYKAKMGTGRGDKTGGETYNLRAFGFMSSTGEIEGYGKETRYWSCSRWSSQYSNNTKPTNSRMFSLYIKYSDGATGIFPIYGNTESYGCPILPMVDWEASAY